MPSSFRRKRRRDANVRPTSDLVAILSSIAATLPTVHASQPPPEYLCPALSPQQELPKHKRNKQQRQLVKRDVPEINTYEAGSGHPHPHNMHRSPVVDRYVPDDDGRWHKVADYNWYGHGCQPCSAQPSSSSSPYEFDTIDPTSSPVPSQSPQFPVGWSPVPETTHEDLPAIIMALSLALAVLICVSTIGWIFWRRRSKSRHTKVKPGDDDVEGRQRERERRITPKEQSKEKQKLWARASARWKSNVRLTARRRRVDQALRHSTSTLSVAPFHDSGSATPATPLPTADSEDGQVSQTPSSQTLAPEESNSDAASQLSVRRSEEPPQNENISHTPRPSSSPVPSSPPAYIHPPQLPSSPASKSPILPFSDCNLDPVLTAGHVATDDKHILAQRAQLISAPDIDSDICMASTSSQPLPAVPEWEDERFEDFLDHHLSTSMPTTSSSGPSLPASGYLNPSADAHTTNALWPSPPTPLASSSKGKMAAFEQQYALFPEYTEAEPEMGPSAPPFEETEVYEGRVRAAIGMASAPPLGLDEASAPPADYEDVAEAQAGPSAPPIIHVNQGGNENDYNQSRTQHERSTPTPTASAPPIENG